MDTETQTPTDAETVDQILTGYSRIKSELGKTIIGQEDVIDEILISLFAGGHVLITGAPGLAKTLLVKSIAEIFDLQFSRIQFTPDLMPADITGTEVLSETDAGRQLRFVPGPVFANIILADEINRTPPKTQAALLEAMQGMNFEYRPGPDNGSQVHYKGIFDDKDRLMVIICHNTDLGDGWEREGENQYYFKNFSEPKAYPMGINIIFYAMTH